LAATILCALERESHHRQIEEIPWNVIRSAPKCSTCSRTGSWVSILSFLDAGITRFGGRIFELRKQGIEIESREKRVGRSRRVEYRLVPKRGQQGDVLMRPADVNVEYRKNLAQFLAMGKARSAASGGFNEWLSL